MSKLLEIEQVKSGHKFFGNAMDAQEWIEEEFADFIEDSDGDISPFWTKAVKLACQYVECVEVNPDAVTYKMCHTFEDVLNLRLTVRDSADYPDDGRIYAEVTLHDGWGGERTIYIDGAPSVRAIESKVNCSWWVRRYVGLSGLKWAEIDILNSESVKLRTDEYRVFDAWMWRD